MECPRKGYVRLQDAEHMHTVPTVCKTWGCRVCSAKVRSLTEMRMIYGLREGDNSLFITNTYRFGQGSELRSARSVGRDLARFWKELKGEYPDLAWLRTPELTKKGQVHVHHLTINVEGKASCRLPGERLKKWKSRDCRGNCIQHKASRIWERVTGDSFVVDVSRVRSVVGAAGYMAKYMVKGYSDREALEWLGFMRRWSSSRNWPRGAALRLRGTEEGSWERISLSPPVPPGGRLPGFEKAALRTEKSECRNLERIGTDLGMELARMKEAQRLRRKVRKVLENQESGIFASAAGG